MSIWSRIKERLFGGGRKPPPPPPTPPRPPVTPGEPPRRGIVDREIQPANPNMSPVWANMQDTMQRRLTDRGVEEFNRRQDRLRALFDIIADPQQSDWIQHEAYEDLADELADFNFTFRHGLSFVGDFDWVNFGAAYPKLGDR